MRRIKIFHKFLAVMLAISALPLAIVGQRLVDINRQGLEDLIMELHTREVTAVSDSIEEYMANLSDKVRFVVSAHGEGVINWTLTQRILQSLIASSADFLTVSGVARDGRELTKVFHPDLEGKVELEDRSEDTTFLEARDKGEVAVSGIYYEDDQPRLSLVYPYTGDIFLYIEASLERLLNKVKETSIGRTGFLYIVDSEGRIVMHPDVERAAAREDVLDRPVVKEVLSRRLVGSKEFQAEDGREVIGAYAPVSALNLGVIIQQDKEEAYFSVYEMRRNALGLLIGAVLFAIIAGYLLAQNLTRPVLKLTGAARSITSGAFDVSSVSEWLGKTRVRDEMSELADTFIVMTRQLKRYTEMQADKLNAVLFSINDGIIMTDYSGNVILSNRCVAPLLGLDSSENMAGKNIRHIIRRKEVEESLKEVRETEDTVVREIDLSAEKSPKHIRMDTSMVRHSDSGELLGTVTVIRDITLEKQLEQLKEDFIHSITHDLRSPMTSIRGFLEFLLDGSSGELNEQQKEFLQIIDESSKRLLGMINNILDVAKMESGTMPMDKEEFSLLSEAGDVVKTFEAQALRDRIDLKAEEVNGPGIVYADRTLMHRVITNLVGNALKFTPEEGSVTVRVEEAGDEAEVSVIDTGQGMPPEYVKKIFKKFEQVKGSRGRRKGTGLGLTITKYIVESHGGRIWAESEEGKGSKFTFRIPVKRENDQVDGLEEVSDGKG